MNEIELLISFLQMIKDIKEVQILEENVIEIKGIEASYYLHAIAKNNSSFYVISAEGGRLLNNHLLNSKEVIDFFTNNPTQYLCRN